MKKLIVPLVAALVMGLLGASAFSYVNAKKTVSVLVAQVTDSIKAHVKDSTEKHDKAQKAAAAAAALAAEALADDSAMMTPADSIRNAQRPTTALSGATHGLANAPDPVSGTLAAKANGKAATPTAAMTKRGANPPVDSKHDVTSPIDPKTKPAPVGGVPHALPAVVESALPENRLVKIFGAMQSKDAAKVLEQMNDSDVRMILNKMGDKQAAAILASFPPQRAAAISKGELKPNGNKP